MFCFKFSLASVHLHFRPKNSSLHIWKLALVKLTSNLMNLCRYKHRNPREQTVNEMAPSKQKWFMPISQRSIRNRSPRLLWSPKILTCNLKSACKSLLRLSEAEVLLPQDAVARPQTWLMSGVILAGSAAQSENKGYYNHGLKSWDTFAFLGRFPIHIDLTPPLTPQTMLDTCIQNFFRVSILYRVGGGRTVRNFRKECTVLRGNPEMTEKHGYCSTVPRTFVQDCQNPGFGGKKSVFFIFPMLFRRFEDTKGRWSHAIIMTFETIFSIRTIQSPLLRATYIRDGMTGVPSYRSPNQNGIS